MRLAALLLVAGAVRHQVWENVAAESAAYVWNICGALAMLVLIEVIVQQHRDAALSLVGKWWQYEEALVAGCSGWHLLDPWEVGPGQELCSSRLGFQLGSITLLALGWIAATLLDDMRRRGRP